MTGHRKIQIGWFSEDRRMALCQCVLCLGALVFQLASVGELSAQGMPKVSTGVASADSGSECQRSENLLKQADFSQVAGERYAWRSMQHSSQPSFVLAIEEDVLTITQAGSEPWFVFKQAVDTAQVAGKRVMLSADMRGDIKTEPRTHGFEYKAGLYYRVVTSDRSSQSFSGDQQPNIGEWDWRSFEVEVQVPQNLRSLEIGFFHQAGGVLYAKNPSLVILECPE